MTGFLLDLVPLSSETIHRTQETFNQIYSYDIKTGMDAPLVD